MSPRTRNVSEYEATLEQIKAIARQQMATEGTAAISLRAIAREMDVTAPALYRYFPSRDDLITALIFDAYNAQADAMADADDAVSGDRYTERILSVMMAYRAWALEHPTDFQLIYGNPIPDYEAPAEITMPAARRGFEVVVGILGAAEQAGVFHLQLDDIPPAVAATLMSVREHEGYPCSLPVLYVATVGWAKLHGLVMLELFNQIQPLVGDTEAFFCYEVSRFIENNGLALNRSP